MKRLFVTLSTAVLLLCAAAPNAAAVYDQVYIGEPQSVVARAEVTEWRYRTYNGHVQKRLWSITNGCWIGDWITIV